MLLDNYLKKCYDENAYIDFYREELAGIEVIFGNISYLGKEIIAVNEYNDNGIFDGISVFYKSDITRVRKGGNEQEAIYKLAEQKNQIIKPEFVASEKQDLIDFVSTNWRNYTFTVFTERLDSDILFIGNYLKSDQNHLLIKALTSFKSFDHSVSMFGFPLNLDGYPNLKDFMGIIYLKHALFQLLFDFFQKTCTWR